jgi:hypothetical protein
MKRFILSALVLLLLVPKAFAGWDKKPEFRWQQLYHRDTRQSGHQLYSNRFWATFNYLDKEGKSLFKLAPFFEMRRNIDQDLWERRKLGAELGKDITPWMYLGDAIQYDWMNEDYRYYTQYEKRDFAESETKLLFHHQLFSNKYITLNGFFLEQYTTELNDLSGKCNEVAIGLIVPVGKYLETCINWRHIDRIHYYDSDTFDVSATLIF